MPSMVPPSLRILLDAGTTDDTEKNDRAWEAFLQEHSGLLLHAAKSLGGDSDAVMDRYAFMVEALRKDGCQRLRGYADDGRSTFTTWLFVVARRLCLDQYRQRYGRSQGRTEAAAERHRDRRQLVDLLGDELGFDQLESAASAAPDAQAARSDQHQRVHQALATLDAEDRLILRLRFEEGKSVPEIGRLLGLGSPFSLYRRIDRVLGHLRNRLRSLGIVDAGS